jgi:hypothetical protein
MRSLKLLALALAAAALPACSSFNMNFNDTPPEFPEATFDLHGTTDALSEYDGDIINASFLGTGERKGELAMIDIWPFVGVGVGVAGVRVRILPLELGIGLGFYAPSQPTGDGDGEEAAAE